MASQGGQGPDDGRSPDQPSAKKLDKLKAKLKSGSSSSNAAAQKEGSAQAITRNNLSLDPELGKKSLAELLKTLTTDELMTGFAPGKNRKDMADHKFWSTQPVPKMTDRGKQLVEGPIELPSSDVPTEGVPLLGDFEWVTMDLDDELQLKEVYQLLSLNYVEDDDASFRFDYSSSFLRWALQSPGFYKDWHVGVRVKASKRLVAFISGIPIRLRVRDHEIKSVEINFMCVHKKLRSKRLAPTLIKEVTRRCHARDIWQAVYTAGVVLPTPVSSCRYYHRSLDWAKLYEVGFSHLPARSTKARQITKFKLPDDTQTPGIRPMTKADVPGVTSLLKRTLERFSICQVFDETEVEHWLLSDPSLGPAERVVWCYVVADDKDKVTDFVSFYSLPSSIIGNARHKTLNAAYLFYYGCELAFEQDNKKYHARLQSLVNDALIVARGLHFDVFNALTLLDNPAFLDELKFGPGDGFLNFYLYNWVTGPIAGGLKQDGSIDRDKSEVGLVML